MNSGCTITPFAALPVSPRKISEMDPSSSDPLKSSDGIGSSSAIAKDVDGIRTDVEGFEIFGQNLDFTRQPPHPNLAQALYSISIATPDLRRTVAALGESLGEARRLLEPTPEISMALFKLGSPAGPVIVEVSAEAIAPRLPVFVPLPDAPPHA